MNYTSFSKFIEANRDKLDPRMVLWMENNAYCTCGYEHAINISMTEIICTNITCSGRVFKRLLTMCKDLQIMDIGAVTAEKIVEEMGISNPLQLFMYEPDKDGALCEGVSLEKSYKIYEQLSNIVKPYWEFLRASNITGVRDSALKVMKGVEDFKELKARLDTEGVSFIHSQLGLAKSETDSITAIQIYRNIRNEIDTLVEVQDWLKTPTIRDEITIVISEEVYGDGYKTKDSFVNYINQKYAGKVYVRKLNSISGNVDYLVWEGKGGATTKVEKAESKNIKIITSKEFLDILRREYGG